MRVAKATSPMHDIYQRLRRIGFPCRFVRDRLLPDWWEDELAAVPANRAQVEMMLSRQLGLSLQALHEPSAHLELQPRVAAKFKARERSHIDAGVEN